MKKLFALSVVPVVISVINTAGCRVLKDLNLDFNPKYAFLTAVFSPDGRKIVCATRSPEYPGWKDALYSMDTDGSDLVKIADGIGAPHFLPGNSRYLLALDSKGQKLFMVDMEQNKITEVYAELLKLGEQDRIEAISHDCSNILINRVRRDYIWWRNHQYSILDLHTSRVIELMPLDKMELTRGFAFSPDNSSVVFDCDYNIYLINANGSRFRCLTEHAQKKWGEIGGVGTGDPIFSPDGKLIAFKTAYSLFIMNNDGTGLKKIVEIDSNRGSIFKTGSFTPDGKQILFVKMGRAGVESGNNCILIVNTNGTNLRVFLDDEIPYTPFSFSPDGKMMVFEGGSDRVLYTINLDGSDRKRIFPLLAGVLATR